MAGEVTRTPKSMRHPLDWCVEQGWEWEACPSAFGALHGDVGGLAPAYVLP